MFQTNTHYKYLKYKHKYLNLKHESNNGAIQIGGADKMVLVHASEARHLLDILNSGYILPASVTKNKNYNPYDVNLKYIFMNTMPDDNESIITLDITAGPYFIFPSSILQSRIFYTNVHHSAGNLATSVKYPRGYTERDNALLSLYKHSTDIVRGYSNNKLSPKDFLIQLFAFQEIFFSRKLALKWASYIIIKRNMDASTDIIEIIKNRYPNIKIIID